MLILTVGFPKSGKSKVIDMLPRGNHKWHIIRPSDWIPDNLSSLDEQMQREYNIGCWSMAIEKTKETIASVPPREIIVLDACNSKFNTLLTVIADAKAALHHVVSLFVQAQSNLCLDRDCKTGAAAKLTVPLLNDYAERFKTSLPRYKQSCDLFLVVRNNGTLEQLETELYDIWKRLCQSI